MKRNHFILLLILASLALMFWAGWANYESRRQQAERLRATHVTLQQDSADQEVSQLQGKPAPNFTLSDLNGKKVSLADYRGKAVLLNFWATWCAPCKVEIPWFLKLREQYAGQGFEILGVSSDDLDKEDRAKLFTQKAEIAKFVEQQKMTYPVLIDGDSISNPYGGVDSLPTSFYIDRKGTVVAQTVGLVPRDEVEANIRKALAGGQ
ncbi:MAG TPA: TlpA disulfide reductase family protein [Acidisarcina sp.]|nr:TlpA disulfide reductase family protein [Acidisarcina sp.]